MNISYPSNSREDERKIRAVKVRNMKGRLHIRRSVWDVEQVGICGCRNRIAKKRNYKGKEPGTQKVIQEQ